MCKPSIIALSWVVLMSVACAEKTTSELVSFAIFGDSSGFNCDQASEKLYDLPCNHIDAYVTAEDGESSVVGRTGSDWDDLPGGPYFYQISFNVTRAEDDFGWITAWTLHLRHAYDETGSQELVWREYDQTKRVELQSTWDEPDPQMFDISELNTP